MAAHRNVNTELIATPSVEPAIRCQDLCDKLILVFKSLFSESESSLKRDGAFFRIFFKGFCMFKHGRFWRFIQKYVKKKNKSSTILMVFCAPAYLHMSDNQEWPCNSHHDEKDATTLEPVLAFSQAAPANKHTHILIFSGPRLLLLYLKRCHYGHRLDEGWILTSSLISQRRTSVCRDTAAKSCWEREME